MKAASEEREVWGRLPGWEGLAPAPSRGSGTLEAAEPRGEELCRPRELRGAWGAALAAALARVTAEGGCLAVIVPDVDEAARMADDLQFFLSVEGRKSRCAVWEYPSPDPLARAHGLASSELMARQARVLGRLAGATEDRAMAVVTSAAALWPHLPAPDAFRRSLVHLRAGEAPRRGGTEAGTGPAVRREGSSGTELTREALLAVLEASGYQRASLVEAPGDWAARGGILDVFPFGEEAPLRLEWDEDRVASLRRVDVATQESRGSEPDGILVPLWARGERASLLEYLPEGTRLAAHEPDLWGPDVPPGWAAWPGGVLATSLSGAPTPGWPARSLEHLRGRWEGLEAEVAGWRRERWTVWYVCENEAEGHRFRTLLEERGWWEGYDARLVFGSVSGGFLWPARRWAVVPDHELTERYRTRPPRAAFRGRPLTDVMELHRGDFVVHVEYGIGRYAGSSRFRVEGALRDFLTLEYAEGNKLHVPLERFSVVQRYLGGVHPNLHHLGTAAWERVKARVKAKARIMAERLLKLYAEREAAKGFAFPPDGVWQREFEASFPYEDTPDQRAATDAIKAEMERPRPMDHLLCGDVGFGKTEVAVRAAFKVVTEGAGKQVAVLAPTTVLAEQHWRTFRDRMAEYPVRVEMLSRFVPSAAQRAVREGLREGRVQVVVGTHRLLQRDVVFRDLGLLIVDEEQRFGVAHKERMKELCKGVHVLTLSATPIPRTLQFALAGLRSLSTIETPPHGRQPVLTYVLSYDEAAVRAAIGRELDRGGQVFYVQNRIERLPALAARLGGWFPGAPVGVAHGRLSAGALERIMMDLWRGRVRILAATSIVELGLDLPNVNTLIVEDAERFGLSELYQLRGRVGRSDRQAYALLTSAPETPLSVGARARLTSLLQVQGGGAGLRVALKDLELRGAGNLLGAEQHGFVAAVGLELYGQLLSEAVSELKGDPAEARQEPVLALKVDAFVPEEYVADDANKLLVYRELSRVRTLEELGRAVSRLEDRYGPRPEPVRALCDVVELRCLAEAARVARIEEEEPGELRVLTRAGERTRVKAGPAWAERMASLREVLGPPS